MCKTRLFAAGVCAVAVIGVGATGALAGEVKGPPTNGDPNTNTTQGPAHANSACAFSGLNDFINGPMDKPTQTPADFNPGDAGHGNPEIGFPNGCRGGFNPANPK